MFKTATSFILSTAILLATVAATFVFPVNADGAENTSLVNGNFDTNLNGWFVTDDSAKLELAAAESGWLATGNTAKLTNGGKTSWMYQTLKLKAGKYAWEFTADIYAANLIIGIYKDSISASNLITGKVQAHAKGNEWADMEYRSANGDYNKGFNPAYGGHNYISYKFDLTEESTVVLALRTNATNSQYLCVDNVNLENQNIIAQDDFSNYTRDTSNTGTFFSEEEIDGNKALKFNLETHNDQKTYRAAPLYKMECTEQAVLTQGDPYLIRFRYKVTSISTSDNIIKIAPVTAESSWNVNLLSVTAKSSQSHAALTVNSITDGWQTAEMKFFGVKAYDNSGIGTLDYTNLWISVSGLGTVYIDDVEVVRLDKVTYDSNGGSDVSDITYGETGTDIVFPTAPTRDGYTFTGWYVDAECTTKAVKYNGDAVLYAGWVYTANIVAQDDFGNYTRDTSNTGTFFSEEEIDGNKALKFNLETHNDQKAYRAAPLYKTECTEQAVLTQGDPYLIRFRYKVTSINTSDGIIKIAPVAAKTSWDVNLLSVTAKSSQSHAALTVNSITDGWQTAEMKFFGAKAYDNSGIGTLDYTNLWISVSGLGTVYIDDVEVIRLDKITYDVMGGEELQPIYGEYGTPVTYSYTTKANSVFTGWYNDEALTEKAADVFGGDTTVYAGWKNVIQGGKHSFSYGADIDGSFITEDGKELKYTNAPAAVSVDTNGNVTIKNKGDEAAEYTFLLNDYNGLYSSLAKTSYAVKYGYKASAGTSFAFVTGIGENFAAKCTKNIEVKDNMSSNVLSELHFTGIGKTTEEGVVYYPYLGIRATIPAGGELVLSGITVKNTYIVMIETWSDQYDGDTTFSVDQGDDFNIGWLSLPTLDGYKFMGWYTNASYEHVTGTITVNADTTIYADWLPIGLEADVNGDGKLDILDLVRAKKVFADESAYTEYNIDRAYYLGKAKGDAANLSGIRKLLLGIADSANTANDIRIAGVSIAKFAFVMPESEEGSILSEGISAFKASLSAFNISDTAKDGQPVIKAELTESDAPTSEYTFTVTENGITVSANNAEALIGGLNRLAHMLNMASETSTQLHLNVGYTCPFRFAPLDGEYAISFIDTFSSFDRSLWVDMSAPDHGSANYIDINGDNVSAEKYHLYSIKADLTETGSVKLPAGKLKKTDGKTCFYASNISTKDTMSYKYGVLEVRAKIGAMPLTSSIWLKGVEKNSETGHFPEVDVFETNWQSKDGVDNDNKLGFNVHWWDTAIVSKNIGAQWSKTDNKFSEAFHTYTFVWTPDAYTVYVDGVKYGDYSITTGDLGANEAETFRQPMFLIFGTGIADTNYGPVYNESKYQEPFSDYEIDYVKISQRASDGGLMNITQKSDIEVKKTTEQHEKLLKDFGLTNN